MALQDEKMNKKEEINKELYFWGMLSVVLGIVGFSLFSFYSYGYQNGQVKICNEMGLKLAEDSITDTYRCFTEYEILRTQNETNLTRKIQKTNTEVYFDII